jgi:HSP20 family molecular chaperone IbpA
MDKLDLATIDSPIMRENFRKLDREFLESPVLRGQWHLFDKSFTQAGTYVIRHGLKFVPLDLIETFKTAGVTYDYASFTDEKIEITTAGAARVRFLLGRMR